MDERETAARAPRSAEWEYACDRCGEGMEERRCKIVCPNCGMARDCSDP